MKHEESSNGIIVSRIMGERENSHSSCLYKVYLICYSKLQEDNFYTECYPDMAEMHDAIDDSDDEADYTKMDLVSSHQT